MHKKNNEELQQNEIVLLQPLKHFYISFLLYTICIFFCAFLISVSLIV